MRWSMGAWLRALDDLYVRPASRNRGLSTTALRALTDHLRNQRVRAFSVEVGVANAAARAVYRNAGFVALSDRQLLALPLASPTHHQWIPSEHTGDSAGVDDSMES